MEYDFNKLCLPCYDELLSFAYKRTKNYHQAEDIVQDAMVRALSAWERWAPQGEPEVWARAWMYRIVSNTFATKYQRIKTFSRVTGHDNHKMVTDELHQEEVSHNPYENPDTVGDEVREALDRIRPEWADVIRLIYMEDMSETETADMLGIPPGTVRSRKARGRLALARILAPLARQRFGFDVANVEEALTEESEELMVAV